MGLLYLFPTSAEENEFVFIDNKSSPPKLVISSYGLPGIFWIYAFIAFIVLSLLTYSILDPLQKLFSMAQGFDYVLVTGLVIVLILSYLAILLFLYWRLLIVVTEKTIAVEYRPFGILLYKKILPLTQDTKLEIRHFMDSPNLARINQDKNYKQFQNSGYFELLAINSVGSNLLLDRSSRKNDLEALKTIICKNSTLR